MLQRIKIVLVFITLIGAIVGSLAARELPTVFELDQGYINGFVAAQAEEGKAEAGKTEKVFGFLGVPYAAPPVGELRWRAPQAAPRFPIVPYEAVAPGPHCMQPDYPAASFYPSTKGERNEDCLYLNIWSAASSPRDRRPVMVWIHGGALTRGTGANAVYDGVALAKKGAVVVTVNYRLGVFGYFAHEELTNESSKQLGEGGHRGASGNYGVLDQIAALEWVKSNISAFGGDPDNVTIFGESAGSWSVNALQATPLAKGLFHRVIGQSGGVFRAMQKLRESDDDDKSAHQAGADLAADLGITDSATALADLRALPAQTLLDAASKPGAFSTSPIVDGWVFPAEIREIFANGHQADVPVMIGSNADEMTSLSGRLRPTNLTMLKTILSQQLGDATDKVLAAYGASTDDHAQDAFLGILRDEVFTRQMRLWARAMETVDSEAYLYYFTRVPMHPERDNYGAYHAAEIAYAFDNLEALPYEHESTDFRLEQEMSDLWLQFARTGRPSAPGLPEWPPYSEGQNYLELGDTIRLGTGLCKSECDVLDSVSGATSRK